MNSSMQIHLRIFQCYSKDVFWKSWNFVFFVFLMLQIKENIFFKMKSSLREKEISDIMSHMCVREREREKKSASLCEGEREGEWECERERDVLCNSIHDLNNAESQISREMFFGKKNYQISIQMISSNIMTSFFLSDVVSLHLTIPFM